MTSKDYLSSAMAWGIFIILFLPFFGLSVGVAEWLHALVGVSCD